ncbi:MAG: ATP-binding protein [Candidatus Aminicenantes bacterium]|nr:ATP-binding protein [Candidatus Aminicenantes bacterium]
MDNNRNPGRKNLILWVISGLVLTAGLSFLTSLFIPSWLFNDRASVPIDELRQQERSIKAQFEGLLYNLKQRGTNLVASLNEEKANLSDILFSLKLDPEVEGVAYLKDKNMIFWRGQVVPPSLLPPADGLSHVIRYKANVFLVIVYPVREKDKLALTRLLSFQPPLATPFLHPISFLQGKVLRNALIDYYSDEEDVTGFERIFARHQDEYISQPRSKGDILTIFFPLRNEAQRIVATVNLRSVNPAFRLSHQRANWQLIGWINLLLALIGISLISFIAWKKTKFFSLYKLSIFLVNLILIRLVLLRLEALIDPKGPLFSPGLACLPFYGRLLSSPLNLFFTSALILALLFSFLYDRRSWLLSKPTGKVSAFKRALAFFLIIISILPLFVFYQFSLSLILNSNLHFIRFSPFWPTLLTLFTLSFFFLTCLFLSWLLVSLARRLQSGYFNLWLVLLSWAVFLLCLHFTSEPISRLRMLILSVAATCIWLFIFRPLFQTRALVRLAFLALAVAFFYLVLASGILIKEKVLTESYLFEALLSLENWAEYFLRESLPAINQEAISIINCLEAKKQSDLAPYLWKKTSLARWNWYSSLEISLPDGQIISRYSLNLPFFTPNLLTLEPSNDWALLRASLPLPGKEADFLIAYRDFAKNNVPLGRLTLYVLLNEEMLPFLYSAIPYFDLLRFPSVPSLKEFNFSLAIFKANGEIIFNPAGLTTGLALPILEQLNQNPENPLWAKFYNRERLFRAFYFRHGQKIVAILWPSPGFISMTVSYLKFLFFWTGLIYLPLFLIDIISGRRRLASLFWAFSSRVYASFVAILLILLVPFTLLINNFFTRLANERFSEKAEIQAHVARNIIEDFLFFQEEQEATFSVQELVHWVSTAINNDVNVYQDGALVASSRQEFFDSGLLPDYLEGEIAYRLKEKKQPYVVWRKRLGEYSFQTLTIPLHLDSISLFITLSFPFEREEIGRVQEQLYEFLIFMAALSLILIFLFARSIGALVINPVRKLIFATKEISSGNLDVFIDHRGHDEMQTLVEGFNRMVQSLKKHERELAEMSKKAAWAEMARKIAHEVKNPLTPIRLSAEHLLHVYDERPEEIGIALKESVTYIINEVENLRRLAQNFLAFSREAPLQISRFNLKELLLETVFPYQRLLSSRLNFELELPEKLVILGDREKLKIAIRNLLVNAIEAIKGKGEIKIRARREGSQVTVDIIDSGEGMDEATLSRIFEPDFSTKDLGTGLGLPIAKKIIEDHGGKISLISSPGKGTTVSLILPAGNDFLEQ